MNIATFDIEADGLLDSISKIHCIVVKIHGSVSDLCWYPSDKFPDIPSILEFLDKFEVICGHNITGYDLPALRRLHGWEPKARLFDTLIVSRLQRPDRTLPRNCPDSSVGPHSVEAWGYRLGRHKRSHEDWSVFSEEMLLRCKEDVEIQCLIYDYLIDEGKEEGWDSARFLNSKLFWILEKQKEVGWTVDIKHIDRCLYMLDRWINRIDRALASRLPLITECLEKKVAGEFSYVKKPFTKTGDLVARVRDYDVCHSAICGPFSRINSRHVSLDKSDEVKNLLLSLGWEPSEWNIDDNGNKTSPKLSKNDKFIGVDGGFGRLIIRRVQCKQRRGVIEGWKESVRPDGRVSQTFSGLAVTGRLRHSGIVNVPNPETGSFFAKWMRAVFIARPGWVMIGCDSKGNQNRQLAARMGDPDYTNTVLTGKKELGTDEHSLNQKRAGLPSRTLAKNLLYGILFGAGDAKVAKTIKQSVEKSKEYKEAIFNAMPFLRPLIDRLADEWRASAERYWDSRFKRMSYRNGHIKGLDGRPIYIESEHMLLVYTLQSDEAIQMATAYVWFYQQAVRRGYRWNEDWAFLIWYHDEFQLECRPEISGTLKDLAEESIAWAGRFYKIACPHEGDAKIGMNWKETH